jgi:hypothetical protein
MYCCWAVVSGRYVMLILRPLTVTSRRVAVWQARPHKQTICLMYVPPPHLSCVIPKVVENEGIGWVSIILRSVMNLTSFCPRSRLVNHFDLATKQVSVSTQHPIECTKFARVLKSIWKVHGLSEGSRDPRLGHDAWFDSPCSTRPSWLFSVFPGNVLWNMLFSTTPFS